MSKKVPCFICQIPVEVKDERAIAALCPDHKTTENIEKMKATSTHQLLRILNDGVLKDVEDMKVATSEQIDILKEQITRLETQLKNQETIVQDVQENPVKSETTQGTVNEWGEMV